MIHYWPQSLHCFVELKQAGQQEALLLRRTQVGLGIAEGTCYLESILILEGGCGDARTIVGDRPLISGGEGCAFLPVFLASQKSSHGVCRVGPWKCLFPGGSPCPRGN